MKCRIIFSGLLYLCGLGLHAAELPDGGGADSTLVDELREITVVGQSARQRVSRGRLGAESVQLSMIQSLPGFMGENDLIKSLSLLPGVRSEAGGIGGFEVRGGTVGQNNIQLDGISLYNPTHLMGIFSTFNDDAIGQATLYKGPIPAQYGQGVASMLETTLAPGDMEAYHASFSVGLLMAKIKAEGPIVKDKLSFAVSARRSYVDALINMVPKYKGTVLNFYDVTAKMRYQPRGGGYVDLSFFMGKDNLAVKDVMGLYWGNIGVAANWFATHGDRWSFKTTASYTDFFPEMDMTMMQSDQHLREYIHKVSVNERINYQLADDHMLEAGVRSELYSVNSAEIVTNGILQKDIRAGWSNALWLAYEGSAGPVGVEAGVRLSAFTAIGGSRFNSFVAPSEQAPAFRAKTYVSPEPRVSLKYTLTPTHNVKIGASLTTQDLHSIRSSTTSFPFDRYAMTSAMIKPERCWQYVAGYAGMTHSGNFDWSAEAYYKDMRNVYDYMDGRSMLSKINLESIILGGQGRSYGLEMMFRKNNGPLTGWISYTLSRTRTRIDGINEGRWYDASNDRRNDLNITAIYRFNPKWSVSGSWVYASGQPLTAPDVKYQLNGETVYYYSQRNGYKTPCTHRLDLSATYTHHGKRLTSQVDFGFYNVYSRLNPYIVYFEDDPDSPSGTRAVMQALFGLLPSSSYTLKF